MKIWVDDVRPAPEGYIWCKSTLKSQMEIINYEKLYMMTGDSFYKITLIDIDHDAGEYACDGGDYIKLLDWLEETGRNYTIHIHSMNPVGVENMRKIIRRNGWVEV